MVTVLKQPARVRAAGTQVKLIDEYIGTVNSQTDQVSIAHMRSPSGWEEPGQTPEFDEFTVVLNGAIRVETREQTIVVKAGEAVIAHRGGWVRYSTPDPRGAEYIAVCLPAFTLGAAHRDADHDQ